MSSETSKRFSATEAVCSNIKEEPNWAEDNSCSVKQEPEETVDELPGFDPHSWVLEHLKIETEEPSDEYVVNACNQEPNIKTNTNSLSGQAHIQHDSFTQMVSSSYSLPPVNNIWGHYEKVFYCEICCKSFSTKGNLSNHMRSHAPEKPFKCDTCGRCFSFNCNLKTHCLTHTGVKPFQCIVCGKCFSTKGNMSVHLRIHTGERPFKCIVCTRTFTVKDNLQRHMKIHMST